MKFLTRVTCLIILTSGWVAARTWTNQDGVEIEAELVAVDGDKVVLNMEGKEYPVPLASLSEEDQAFAKEEVVRLQEKRQSEARKFMGQELTPGQTHVFDFDLSPENQALAEEGVKGWKGSFAARYSRQWLQDMGQTPKTETIRFFLGVPNNFNPSKRTPVFVQWTTSDIKSHVKGAPVYWNECNRKGWLLVSVEGAPDSKELWTNSVFLAGIKEFFEQLHAKYPGSNEWPVATGGFSGGAKICQWMGGLMQELEGASVVGYWIGGCNEARFDYAIEDLDVSKKAYKKAKAHISSGESDQLVKPHHRARMEDGCDDVNFREVRSEIYAGGHSMNNQQFGEALDWFLE